MGLPANQQNAFAFMGNLRAKIELLEMADPAGGGWRVVEDADGVVLLAHPDHDGPTGYRLAVVPPTDDEPIIKPVFPCRTCGWARTCEEGCHA